MSARNTSLSANVVSFARFLRQKKFSVTVDDEANALTALQESELQNEKTFRLALKSIFCKTQTQLREFDDFFIEYWKDRSKAVDSKVLDKPEQQKTKISSVDPVKSLQSWLNGNRNDEEEQTATYSASETLAQKDFSKIPADEIEQMLQAIKALSKNLACKISRRLQKSSSGKLDLLKTIRKNIRNDSEIIQLIFRRPKRSRNKLILICDVSKSMDLYTQFFLQFMYSFQRMVARMETFVFSTHLMKVTSLLKQGSFEEAMKSLSTEAGWSDGTKIGNSLQQFVKDYPSLISRQSSVIILSDGWDNGEADEIENAMQKIHSAVKKIIWLNPLAGYSEYKPEVKGMKAALPYINNFAAVHNLESLKSLSRLI